MRAYGLEFRPLLVGLFIHVETAAGFDLQVLDAVGHVGVFANAFGAGEMLVDGDVVAEAAQEFPDGVDKFLFASRAMTIANVKVGARRAGVLRDAARDRGHAVTADKEGAP